MQVAAMNPVAVDKADVPPEMIEKEKEIGREQARNEGKAENMLDRIAEGKLNKFFKESTLLNQEFTKDSTKTVRQYLQGFDKDLTVTGFVRYYLESIILSYYGDARSCVSTILLGTFTIQYYIGVIQVTPIFFYIYTCIQITNTMALKYKRILLKLSGEALMGDKKSGI